MEEFLHHLRHHILGLNLGRWDYMASLIHFTLADRKWVLPDRNTIPHDVPFFQNLRELIVELCHKRGIFAIGRMTAPYPPPAAYREPLAPDRLPRTRIAQRIRHPAIVEDALGARVYHDDATVDSLLL